MGKSIADSNSYADLNAGEIDTDRATTSCKVMPATALTPVRYSIMPATAPPGLPAMGAFPC
ncbi:hypothetical protein [Sodalis sp. RH16]|uniref:hypothetical protein n=1 Tax=Sodalis sp. RH16 TaxID=3394331 RepID=UPI0039B57B4A